MIKAVLLVLSKIGLILFFQILAKCNGQFLQLWICSVRSSCITEVMCWSHPWHRAERVTVKFWSQCLQYLQRYLEFFSSHLAAAVPLLETDNISQVCQYIIQIWPVLMACTWKNRDLLTEFCDKISIFSSYLGWTEHSSARCDCPLCTQHHALISFFWCHATWWTWETKLAQKQLQIWGCHTL